MAHERKAGDSISPTKGGRSPIPAGKRDDLEDVSWALSTAEAMWARGDHGEALKWLRRAAESAAEAEADDRALELAKAAADVASLVALERDRPHAPPVAPASPASPIIASPSRPPPPLPTRALSADATGATRVAAAPLAPRVTASAPPLPRPTAQKTPAPPRIAPAPISRRGGRRSSPSFTNESGEKTGRRSSTTSEVKRRGRASKPSPEETMPPATQEWPASRLIDDADEDHTRIGTSAYEESAKTASARPHPIASPNPVPAPPVPREPAIASSQAVRVVVWRTGDGVFVAPAGTKVNAISVEAILVALDPSADLAAWLTRK